MTDLMIPVERVVRPVRAGSRRKNRMREELLAHLTAIYQQERATLGDDRLAFAQAVRRLGDPSEVTRDLQDSVTRRERFEASVERWLGWRGGESGLRFAVRASALTFVATTVLMLTGLFAVGGRPDDWFLLWVAVGYVFMATAVTIPLWLSYFRVRGAVCGGLGYTRSPVRAAAWAAAAGASAAAAGFGLTLLGGVKLSDRLELIPAWGLTAVFVAGFLVWHAWANGPKEIRHAEWELLTVTC